MSKSNRSSEKINPKISAVEVTSDTLSGRGGLALFVRYLTGVGILELLASRFGNLRRSKKGAAVEGLFKQTLCFLFDGTSHHMSHFDKLKQDSGYAGVLEEHQQDLASSHTVKRFFRAFPFGCGIVFRIILKQLFVWRLKLKEPELIELTIDTMVMNNDEAEKREGVEPTYKKVKGFQPLQVIWDGKIVDALLRNGKKNGNSGSAVSNMVRSLVKLIRSRYSSEVTIVVRLDAGFFDQKLFEVFDELGIGFICSGKMFNNVKEHVAGVPENQWNSYTSGKYEWEYVEWNYSADSWDCSYRALYTRPVYDNDGQTLLDFARPDNVIVTNIGVNEDVLIHCSEETEEVLESPEYIIRSHHLRGADELPHRGLKDLGTENLPFKRFAANSAFYYLMVIAFFLFETFKEDVIAESLPQLAKSYATTIRRTLVDFAAKIVRTGGKVILKITKATIDRLKFHELWFRAQSPPPLSC